MPKITEQVQKKPIKKVQPKQEIQKPVEVKSELKVVVYRVFECLVHLEVALNQLKQVGIFPGPTEKSDSLKTRHTIAFNTVETLLKEYRDVWGAMSK